jgi:secreted Zn-dependent insulinase-like peptidase
MMKYFNKQLFETIVLMVHTATTPFVSHPKSMASVANKIVNVYQALVLMMVYASLAQIRFTEFSHGFGVY